MTVSNATNAPNDLGKSGEVSSFRRILPQVIATTIKNIHSFDLGLTLAFPTIIVPALTGNANDQNHNEFLTMTGAEASWIGSIGFATRIIGSLLAALVTEPLGRKLSMILVNIPFAIGWLMLYQATANWHIFVGFAMLGAAVGLMESSVVTFLGEICEPSVRGTLIAFTNVAAGIGIFSVYTLNAWFPWRIVALIALAVPITSTILLCFVPETPQWLLLKSRTEQAEKSLCWLRGWVSSKTPPKTVWDEFSVLKRHSERSNSCDSCIKQDVKCTHPLPTLTEKLADLKRKSTLKPFAILLPLFILSQFTGGFSMRSFVVQIFKAYQSPIPSDENVMICGLIENVANVIFLCSVRLFGKRPFYLAMTLGIFISSFMISCYGFIFLPSGFNSFDHSNQTFDLDDPSLTYIPTVCLYVWIFCTFCGFYGMCYMLLSELYPLRVRTVACGLTASLSYVIGAIATKTYYNLEITLSMAGTSMFYCTITGVGLILMYFIFPETEGRTLEDIELHFSDDSKTLCDRNIVKGTINSKLSE